MLTDKEQFKEAFINKLQTMHGKTIKTATANDRYTALAGVVRDYISREWIKTNQRYEEAEVKQVFYLSIEFLPGKLLAMNLINSGLRDIGREALADLNIDLDELEGQEPDAGLGNGGLGRLAACFLDSLAALGLPGHGCGIRYKYGLFEQKIVDNHQVELPDNWLKDGYIWEFRKADEAVEVKLGGTPAGDPPDGASPYLPAGYEAILAVPYDIPLVGYRNNTVNTLRLWNAEPTQADFDLCSFNRGEYLQAVEYKHAVERISKILYPDDTFYEGRLLRLKQQYFLVSASLQSIIRNFKHRFTDFKDLPAKVAVHINDTHPALAIPELMRLLVDEEGLDWEEAWRITTNTISYTNHTILPEALEKWPVEMLKTLLPRIYRIICDINEQFCRQVGNKYPGDWSKVREMSIIVDDNVYMARLAIVGSYSVNGVAKIHTNILKNYAMKEFSNFFPAKFNNKTNGITHRRWLLKANPALAGLITELIGPNWVKYPHDLVRLLDYRQDAAFQERLTVLKKNNKQRLANHIADRYGLKVDPQSIFDAHIKRIHAYKRQILNILHILHLYNRLKDCPTLTFTPRTFIFAGKAAPGYYIAKQTIKLINVLAAMINGDKTIGDKIKVVFLENYSVSLGELVFPAADVSEQISTAGKEASGTGNMKFMMNGAVTIGTLDGANIEIQEAVGADNMVIFGLLADQVLHYYQYGGYNAWEVYNNDDRVHRILDQLVNGFFPQEKEEFRPLYDYLLRNNDEYFVLKDFAPP